MIIGCDLHTRYQQIAMVDTETGEFVQRRLEHESGEARGFYAGLKGGVRVGIEANFSSHSRVTAVIDTQLAMPENEDRIGSARSMRVVEPDQTTSTLSPLFSIAWK